MAYNTEEELVMCTGYWPAEYITVKNAGGASWRQQRIVPSDRPNDLQYPLR
jgi:hypothetical protein